MAEKTTMGSDEKFREWENENERRKAEAEWPAYRPKKRHGINFTAVCVIIGICLGCIAVTVIWPSFVKMENRLLYPEQDAGIMARYSDEPVEMPYELYLAMTNSSVTGTEAWNAMTFIPDENGNIFVQAPSSSIHYDFITALRAAIDTVIDECSADFNFPAFNSAECDPEYEVMTVSTDVKQESLIDGGRTDEILLLMKAQALLYNGRDTQVSVIYSNNGNIVAKFTK